VLILLSKINKNSPMGICNFKNFPGIIPWTPVITDKGKGAGEKEREGKEGEVRMC
jgi:hypothetical protein